VGCKCRKSSCGVHVGCGGDGDEGVYFISSTAVPGLFLCGSLIFEVVFCWCNWYVIAAMLRALGESDLVALNQYGVFINWASIAYVDR